MIGEMTLADAQDLLGMWDEEPPAFALLARIEAMLAAWFGVRRSGGPAGAPTSPLSDAAQMESMLTEAFGAPSPPGFVKDDGLVYDFESLKARHGR